MGYAIFCQNYIFPKWNEFSAPQRKPSKWAQFKKAFGFPGDYDTEVAEIKRLGEIDPAQEDINWWIKKWKLPADAFKGRPERVDLPSTKRRVSEIYESRDQCSEVFDLKFANREARNASEWGSAWIDRSNSTSFCDIVAYTYNKFTIEEVSE